MIADTPVSYSGLQGQFLSEIGLDFSLKRMQVQYHKLHHLTEVFPEDNEVNKIVEQGLLEVATLEEKESAELGYLIAQTTDKYIGHFVCGQCHQEQMTTWNETKHAIAWQGLHSGSRKADSTCFSCHTTGMNEGGFVDQQVTDFLTNVQCESCHGFGRDHVINPDDHQMPIKQPESSCKNCHDISHSPNYDYQKYWKEVAH